MPKKAAVRLWQRARNFDRGTHQPGRHGGAVGHKALQVLHALIFDFLNHRTSPLDLSCTGRGALRPHGGHRITTTARYQDDELAELLAVIMAKLSQDNQNPL